MRLDRFWANEEIYYNYKTNISCTGSRSKYDVDLEWLLLLKFMCKYCIFTMDWTSWYSTRSADYCARQDKTSRISYVHILLLLGHMNIRGPQLFYSFFHTLDEVVRIGVLFADWSCASQFSFSIIIVSILYIVWELLQKYLTLACNHF